MVKLIALALGVCSFAPVAIAQDESSLQADEITENAPDNPPNAAENDPVVGVESPTLVGELTAEIAGLEAQIRDLGERNGSLRQKLFNSVQQYQELEADRDALRAELDAMARPTPEPIQPEIAPEEPAEEPVAVVPEPVAPPRDEDMIAKLDTANAEIAALTEQLAGTLTENANLIAENDRLEAERQDAIAVADAARIEIEELSENAAVQRVASLAASARSIGAIALCDAPALDTGEFVFPSEEKAQSFLASVDEAAMLIETKKLQVWAADLPTGGFSCLHMTEGPFVVPAMTDDGGIPGDIAIAGQFAQSLPAIDECDALRVSPSIKGLLADGAGDARFFWVRGPDELLRCSADALSQRDASRRSALLLLAATSVSAP